LDKLSDESLMRIILGRSTDSEAARKALAELYNRYANLCLSHNYRLLHSGKRSASHARATSEDITQQKFLKILKLKSFHFQKDISNSVRRFLFTVDHNDCINYMKKKSVKSEENVDPAAFEYWESALFDAQHDPLQEQIEALDHQKQKLVLKKAMATLSTAQFNAVHYWSIGHSYREIAELTGHQETKIRGYIWHGLKKLRVSRISAS